MECPNCGNEAYQESADVGVGVIYGPWGRPCGWSEDERYNLLNGPKTTDKGYVVDQYGGLTPPLTIGKLPEWVEQCEYPVEDPTDEWAEDFAAKKNCRVVYPKSNQLQIDIDSDEAMNEFVKRYADFLKWDLKTAMNQPEMAIEPSKSGLPHCHITLTFPGYEFDKWERIALQMLLGSDLVREKMNTLRTLKGNKAPVRLFEPLEA